jgi:hypothetical protein
MQWRPGIQERFKDQLCLWCDERCDPAEDMTIDQRTDASYQMIQGAKCWHLIALLHQFVNGCIDEIRWIFHRVNGPQDGANGDPASVFAIGKDLIVLSYHLMVTGEDAWAVIDRNQVFRERARFTNMGHDGSGNFIHARKIAQTGKEFEPEHEIELILPRTGHSLGKVAFLFRWGIGFNQFFGSIAALYTVIRRSIQRGYSGDSLFFLK